MLLDWLFKTCSHITFSGQSAIGITGPWSRQLRGFCGAWRIVCKASARTWLGTSMGGGTAGGAAGWHYMHQRIFTSYSIVHIYHTQILQCIRTYIYIYVYIYIYIAEILGEIHMDMFVNSPAHHGCNTLWLCQCSVVDQRCFAGPTTSHPSRQKGGAATTKSGTVL